MELSKSSLNPEDLMHPTYREHIVKYLVGLASFSKPVVVFSKKGYGLTRLLRFITYGSYSSRPSNTFFIYLNYLDFVDKPLTTFESTLDSIYIENKKGVENVCFLIDELMFDDDLSKIFRLIRTFRGKFNNIGVSYIVGITLKGENSFSVSSPPEYITDFVGNNTLVLPPLTQIDFFKTATTMANQMGLTIEREDLEEIYTKTVGVPAELKHILQDRFKKQYLGEEVEDTKGVDLILDKEKIMCGVTRIDLDLTRSEELVLRLLIQERGKVVHRDKISEVLSPESDGEGVSNESIDQIIYRIRKKLGKIGCAERIETYVGKGYGIVGG